jgi:hypothetical protein
LVRRNYLIDLKAAVIVDVEATRAIRQAEVGAARTMIERQSLRAQAQEACRRQRLRIGSFTALAGRGQGNCAAHHGLRQIQA